jgi:signal transduction histidine kinase
LDVRDDGVGFDPDRPSAVDGRDGGFGLTVMRQRLDRVAGTLEVESERGGGTAVSASAPIIPEAPATPRASAMTVGDARERS